SQVVKTHSPELYAHADKEGRHNIKRDVLNLMEASFDTRADGDSQFLDIGCGVGAFTKSELLPRSLPCRRIVAADVSEDMLNYAKKHSSHPKIIYDLLDIGADVSEFVDKYGQFDRVYSFSCLNWTDQEVAFKNISKLLTPGGECLVFYPARAPFLDWLLEVVRLQRWRSYSEV
ncbi:unnamed protein product, partial [Ixodes hexagonus]